MDNFNWASAWAVKIHLIGWCLRLVNTMRFIFDLGDKQPLPRLRNHLQDSFRHGILNFQTSLDKG